MIKRIKLKGTSIVCVLLLLLFVMPYKNAVYAGISPVIVSEADSLIKGLDPSVWYYTSSGISVSGGSIVFDQNSTSANTRIASRKKMYNLASIGTKEAFSANITMTINHIPEERKFGLMFGLSIPAENAGVVGSSMMYFTVPNSDAGIVYLGFSNYTATGEQIVLSSHALDESNVSLGTEFEFVLTVKSDGGIKVDIGDAVVYKNDNADAAIEGYFGFGQIGGDEATSASINSASVIGYQNSTPENTDYGESFSNDAFNTNYYSTRSKKGYLQPSYQSVENNALMFRNVATAFISTRLDFSNAVLDIDIPYIQREAEFDTEGKLSVPISTAIGIAFGAESSNTAGTSAPILIELGSANASPTVKSNATRVTVRENRTKKEVFTLPDEFHLWSEDIVAGRTINVRVYSLNGKIHLYLKYSNQTGFTHVFSYDLGYTPLGKIQVLSNGTDILSGGYLESDNITQGNFSISYISVGNLDDNAKKIIIEYKYSAGVKPDDYIYENTWDNRDLPFGDNKE